MDGLHIGPWREEDRVTLAKVLDETDVLTGQFRSQQGLPTADPFRISLVARDDSGPVGVATAFESRWHPRRLWVSVEVASSHRRQGVGSALLGAIRSESRGRPLRAKVFAGDAAAGFAAARGFRVIQRSRTVRLDGPRVSTPAMSVEIDAAPDAVATALLDIYVRTHSCDPPGDIDVDDVLAVHVADAAVTLLVRDATGVVLAAAGLRHGNRYPEPRTALESLHHRRGQWVLRQPDRHDRQPPRPGPRRLRPGLPGGPHVDNGATLESNFHDFKWTRMFDSAPEMTVHILPNSNVTPGGLGELGLPAATAAAANAWARATGKQPRNFPLNEYGA